MMPSHTALNAASITLLHAEYAQVLRMLGQGRLEAQCMDGVKRLCHIRGKMRKKVWVNVGDIVLLGLREYQVRRMNGRRSRLGWPVSTGISIPCIECAKELHALGHLCVCQPLCSVECEAGLRYFSSLYRTYGAVWHSPPPARALL